MALNAVSKEIEGIANKYRCDPQDPIFGILEKVIEIREQLPVTPVDLVQQLTQELRVFLEGFAKDKRGLEAALAVYDGLNQQANTLALKTGQNLIAASQVKLRERVFSAFLGMLFPAALLLGCLVWYFTLSLEARLSHAGLHLKIDNVTSGTRVNIVGPKIIRSGETDNKVTVEFRSE